MTAGAHGIIFVQEPDLMRRILVSKSTFDLVERAKFKLWLSPSQIARRAFEARGEFSEAAIVSYLKEALLKT